MISPTELRQIVQTAQRALANSHRCALATVVQVAGSSYRRPGARLLVCEDGTTVGSVSGGCLEDDVARKCRLSMAEGRTLLVHYDTDDEDAVGLGAATGCRGQVSILVEPLHSASRTLTLLAEAEQRSGPSVLVTRFGETTEAGAIELVPSGAPYLDEHREVLRTGRPPIARDEAGGGSRLLEFIAPAPELILFGAGPDCIPLSACASLLGFRVTVSDQRPGYLARRALPPTVRGSKDSPEQLLRNVGHAPTTACVIATHSLTYDQRILTAALGSEVAYIGLLGPRSRGFELRERIAEILPAATDFSRLYGPVGLDIGAETPEQIAVSILAEIQAVFARRSAGFLRDRHAPIHITPITRTESVAV